MRRYLVMAGIALMLSGGAAAAPRLQPVAEFDVGRYMGKWYEIARYPNRFQAACRRNTTTEYHILDSDKISVANRCERDNGSIDQADGQARAGEAGAQLDVRFAPAWLSWLPWVWAPYWVVQLAPDYRYAVVSEPKREYLWILARSPRLSADDESAIFARLSEQGFDTQALRRTEQTGAGQP